MGMTVFLLVAIIGTLFGVPMAVLDDRPMRKAVHKNPHGMGWFRGAGCLVPVGACGMVPVSGLVLQYDLLIRMECVEWA